MTTHQWAGRERRELDEGIDRLDWGLLLIAIGIALLVPGLPDGSWLVASGAVILGTSAVRASQALPVHGAAVAVGLVALAAGLATAADLGADGGPVVPIVLGLAFVAGAAIRARRRDSVAGEIRGGEEP